MTPPNQIETEPPPSATDMPPHSWIDRHVPTPIRPYFKLARLDRPIGAWLLLFPCWWGIALAGDGAPDLRLVLLFGAGAFVMRGAGATFNDIVDRDFDARVARTRTRPIPSGAVSRGRAASFMVALLVIGLAILLSLDRFAIFLGVASLALVFTYPFMKRITYWPQAFLGITFNWGALMGYAAATGGLDAAAIALYGAGIAWTLGYDTIYAHQDKEDDARIGVKSTALVLGGRTRPFLFAVYGAAIALMAGAGILAGLSWPFHALLGVAALHLVWQAARVDLDDPGDCLAMFRANFWFGWLALAAILAGGLTG